VDFGLRGKTAIVAAASRGLGRAVALALAEEGANVVIFSRDPGAIAQTAQEIQHTTGSEALGLTAEATHPGDLQAVVTTAADRFGTVHVVYNNAGGPRPGFFDTLSDEDWEAAFQLNLLSAVRLTRLCLPYMRRQAWGRVITGTSSSVKQPIEDLMLSNSIRSATTAWSKTLADQVARDGITVNTLAPGRILTERLRQIDAAESQRTGVDLDEITRRKVAEIPVGRYGEPAEFGAAAAFLASEQASYITGVTLLVDGGMFRGTY
jgi:3-oxoacyl-[acyl-carrier protein] reductase